MAIKIVDPVETCKRIVSYMKALGYSAKDIARYLQLTSPQAVYKWIYGAEGKNQNIPNVDNLVALADLFGVTVDDLIVKKDILIKLE